MPPPSSDGGCKKETRLESAVNEVGDAYVVSPSSPLHEDSKSLLGDDVVISGISCRLPQSDNMAEFKDNLLNGVDMVTQTDPRWKPGSYGLPERAGLIKDLSKFDAEFFGVSPKQANSMDPQIRILLEVTYECIVDAGVNPDTIRGTRTGVFVGAVFTDSNTAWSADPETTSGYVLTGCSRSMLANRLSFHFDFKGPSYPLDTACSSSLLAMDQALHSIRSGQCDAAIVAGSNLCLRPSTSLQFQRLGMLSPQGMCKSFDADGDGYCRSEGIVAIYLQKESEAKRLYCTLVHSKTKTDGYKEQGITFPSCETQKSLLRDVYNEACEDPATVAYIEAHGTGTKAGDPQEASVLCDIFCKDREGPLPIGSVKSNMGHCEPTSGLAAVAKVIVAMEAQTIPGNLHFNTPNPDIPGLTNGNLQVVTSNKIWQGGIVGINSSGFGGTNVHAILKSKSKEITTEETPSVNGKRLFLYSSRSEEGLKDMLQRVRDQRDDLNFHALVNETANMSPTTHPYRGFTILNGKPDICVQKISSDRRPVWYVFSGMGTQWCGMGRKMMDIDVFRASIMKSDAVLKPMGVQLYQLLMNGDESVFEGTVHSFVGIVSIQVALVDVLTKIGTRPDGIVGHSVGELGCAYADGCLTAEQTVLAAYWRGRCIQNADLSPGGMAAVGLTWQNALEQCPPGVVPACHNATDTVTVSGPKHAVNEREEFMQETQHTQQTATRKAQNQDKKTA